MGAGIVGSRRNPGYCRSHAGIVPDPVGQPRKESAPGTALIQNAKPKKSEDVILLLLLQEALPRR